LWFISKIWPVVEVFPIGLVYGVAVVRAILDAPCDIEQFAGLLTVLRSAAAREAIFLASERPDLPNAPTLLAITYSSAS
jgi:hypothetical protein